MKERMPVAINSIISERQGDYGSKLFLAKNRHHQYDFPEAIQEPRNEFQLQQGYLGLWVSPLGLIEAVAMRRLPDRT